MAPSSSAVIASVLFHFFFLAAFPKNMQAKRYFDSSYDEPQGIRYTRIAGAAYCPVDQILSWTCAQCVSIPAFTPKLVMNNDTKILRGFIGIDEQADAIVISFRGTVMTVKDWITDLDILKVAPYDSYPDAEVHKGFYEAYLYFQPQILEFLGKVISTNDRAEI